MTDRLAFRPLPKDARYREAGLNGGPAPIAHLGRGLLVELQRVHDALQGGMAGTAHDAGHAVHAVEGPEADLQRQIARHALETVIVAVLRHTGGVQLLLVIGRRQ